MTKHRADNLTMARELERLLDAPDEEEPSMTVRQALCKAVIHQAKNGNFKMLQWLYQISGEQRRGWASDRIEL